MSETWVPADGAGGVIYLTYDADDIALVHRTAMEWLLRRADFAPQSQPDPGGVAEGEER